MEERKLLFTSEAVSEGHPDKVCDQIADAILDFCLSHDENARVACEVFVSTQYVLIGGEITCKVEPNYEEIVHNVLNEIGYNKDEIEFSSNKVQIDVRVKKQSNDIAMGVNSKSILNMGAGDQGIMFGYASDETKGYMPLPLSIAQKLVRLATNLRKNGSFKNARPDMKSQVTINYEDAKNPLIDTILMSCQHDEDFNELEFKDYIYKNIMLPVAKSFNLNEDFKVLINPTGRFVIGGPASDTGVTGRKIIADSYGGSAKHGGGAFSGKDPSKVDRSAAYMARYIAKNLVAAKVAHKMEIQLGYAIGCSYPLSVSINTFGTSIYSEKEILNIVDKVFDLRPGMIIKHLSLQKPSFKYQDVSNYGHFGRPDLDLPWEKLDKVEEIKSLL